MENIIQRLIQQRTAIENAIAALREVSGDQTKKRRGRPRGAKKRNITPEGRQRQIEAMRRYWAAKRAAARKSAS
jgi:hypothetical protein